MSGEPPKKKKKAKSPVDGLSNDQLYLLKDTFMMFDRKNKGEISTSEMADVFNALGVEASEADIQDLIDEADVDGGGTLDFPEFVLMMAQKMGDQDQVMEEVIKCFKAFDPDQTGMIATKAVIEVMVLMGDRMPKMDCEEMMAIVGVEDGMVDYEKMVEAVAAGSKNETPEEKFDSLEKKKTATSPTNTKK